jgi:D-alanine-D-alanine ligase
VPSAIVTGLALDVIFPMLHGPYGEGRHDPGPAGAGQHPLRRGRRLASAVGMDKAAMKVHFAAHGLPVCPYRVVLRHEWKANGAKISAELEKALKYPMFTKPANLGSSVGPSRR